MALRTCQKCGKYFSNDKLIPHCKKCAAIIRELNKEHNKTLKRGWSKYHDSTQKKFRKQ